MQLETLPVALAHEAFNEMIHNSTSDLFLDFFLGQLKSYAKQVNRFCKSPKAEGLISTEE